MAIADPQSMQAQRLALLPTIILSPQYLKSIANEPQQTYHIQDLKCSENAWLIFNANTVIKILRPYDDYRYSLKKLENRHECLLEGLDWNRRFTKDVHLGLARFCSLDAEKRTITLGKILEDPKLDELESDAEYVLVMSKLPKQYRLDCLLKNSDQVSLQYHESLLSCFLSHIHTSSSFPVVSSGKNSWGGIIQLRNKLIHNFETVEQPIVTEKSILETNQYILLRSTCEALRTTLLPIFWHPRYQNYFNERIERRQIKRCHGDLKARNIWIMPETNSYSEFVGGVSALDAIDFNPDYCNIDTLSDFAMLVADIYARTNSQEISNRIITDYIERTNQEDEVARFVLKYYLVEKAFVGAYVSILYDDSPKLGWSYLKTTKRYLGELRRFMGSL